MDNKNDIKAFYQRFLDNRATAAEVRELMAQFGTTEPEELQALVQQALGTSLDNSPMDAAGEQVIQQIHERLQKKLFPVPRRFYVRFLPYAAAVLLIGTGIYFFIVRKSESQENTKTVSTEILPGFNQATLTLANGKTIRLDSAQSGIIVNNVNIKYNNGNKVLVEKGIGQVAPDLNPPGVGHGNQYSILTTPKGGQYQIILSDGTKIWLNAASTLKYPNSFVGGKRVVELEGEAFFDVAQVKDAPFLVKSRGQEVRVIATAFNLSSYSDEKEIKTTLVNGAVEVSMPSEGGPGFIGKRLKPGQQAVNEQGIINVITVDVNNELAWREGVFSFQGKSFTHIMRELSRWYDLEVIYEGTPPTNTYFGSAFRDDKLSVILGLLKSSNINYRLEDRKLFISTKKRRLGLD